LVHFIHNPKETNFTLKFGSSRDVNFLSNDLLILHKLLIARNFSVSYGQAGRQAGRQIRTVTSQDHGIRQFFL